MSTELFDYTDETFTSGNGNITGSTYGSQQTGIQFTIADTITVDYYMIDIGTVLAAGTLKAYLAEDNSGSFGTEVDDSAVTLSVSTTGIKTLTLSTGKALSAGTYWLMFANNTAGSWFYVRIQSPGQTHRIVYSGTNYVNNAAIEAGLYYSEEAAGMANDIVMIFEC